MKRNRKRKIPGEYLRGLAFMLGLVLLTACQKERASDARVESLPPDPVVAMINREPVSAAEYRMVMERNTALVYGYFKRTQDLDDHPGYWKDDSDPNGPLAKLREMVQEELVKIKVCQGLAREKGLVRVTSFADFQADFERENSRRSKARSEGRVVYGVSQYRLAAYYYVRQGDLTYRLKKNLAQEAEAGIKEQDIKKFYDQNRKKLGKKSFKEMRQSILTFLSEEQADRQLEKLCRTAKVEMESERLRGIVPRVDVGSGVGPLARQ